jgi:hypothetical protein
LRTFVAEVSQRYLIGLSDGRLLLERGVAKRSDFPFGHSRYFAAKDVQQHWISHLKIDHDVSGNTCVRNTNEEIERIRTMVD